MNIYEQRKVVGEYAMVRDGAEDGEFKTMSEAELAKAFVETVQDRETTEHVGRLNRLMDRGTAIVDELKARGAARLALQKLLDHADPKVSAAAQSKLDWFDRPAPEPWRPPPGNWETLWQCNHPPPPALTRAEIARRLGRGLPEFSDQLSALAVPAIGLWPQRLRTDLSPTASRFGGMPMAPPDWQWPTVEEEPLLFVGQINCAELDGLPGAEQLPSTGLLAFFGDHDAVQACRIEACEDIAVYHWTETDRLVSAAAPIEPLEIFPACPLAIRPQIDLPDPISRTVEKLRLNEEQMSFYAAEWKAMRRHGIPDEAGSWISFCKLLGWPALVQLDHFGFFDDPSLQLLLQVDDYCNGEELHGWGPGGSLYFMVPNDDLRAQRFDRCEFEIQFT